MSTVWLYWSQAVAFVVTLGLGWIGLRLLFSVPPKRPAVPLVEPGKHLGLLWHLGRRPAEKSNVVQFVRGSRTANGRKA